MDLFLMLSDFTEPGAANTDWQALVMGYLGGRLLEWLGVKGVRKARGKAALLLALIPALLFSVGCAKDGRIIDRDQWRSKVDQVALALVPLLIDETMTDKARALAAVKAVGPIIDETGTVAEILPILQNPNTTQKQKALAVTAVLLIQIAKEREAAK